MSKKANIKIINFLIITITACLIIAGIQLNRYFEAQQISSIDENSGQSSAMPVRVYEVKEMVLPKISNFHGFLHPFERITISAQVSGEITNQNIEISDSVNLGQIYFKLTTEWQK